MPAIVKMHKTIIVLLLTCVGLVLGATLAYIGPEYSKQNHVNPKYIEWLNKPRPLENFKLESTSGEFTHQSLLGHWSIVLFGFLHCPDICPTSLTELTTLISELKKKSPQLPIKFIFISVDPQRDTVNNIEQYLEYFDESIVGVTGSQTQLANIAQSLSIQFKVNGNSDNYTLAHSINFSIIAPNGHFNGRFRPNFDVQLLSAELLMKMKAN